MHWRAVGDAQNVGWALWILAQLTDEYAVASRIQLLEEGLELARRSGVTVHVTFFLPYLAAAVAEAGDPQRARLLLDECDALVRATGDTFSGHSARLHRGWLSIAEGVISSTIASRSAPCRTRSRTRSRTASAISSRPPYAIAIVSMRES